MRILGIDYGERNIGLALSDELGITVHPLGKYTRKNKKEDKNYFLKLIKEYNIKRIVIGLPLRMDGTKGVQAQEVEKFGEWLKKITQLPIEYWDERLSTKQAFDILKSRNIEYKEGKKFKDQISAAIILSSYLESKRKL
ncbi:Holliday junction resolvase RuvX [Candidatus Aminicenantes bacterium AC-708-M15]|jgi:putative Holliday junction resolvase|nr:Holliday junction resolvase RuvX [SCandidatus Aminicenantes bacterium Aminicenantia_JdfR_composite]MCP2597943.1 Holliday junction resolvase RuvX [Candidatus Aminicenantes bacterium AC-335-L06]MCP2598981.1 Holliday junction resolvase RuvX [Candidatus Aminicenantes bacterium AC-335-B20]MCP2604310.1 Holliday junction resolvase RuvX [Candidatus Aminicenantes bacterium AC-708-M15]MCP2606075.1 Holliday junction resolvase RuvX [Candidatus Aminicenantes bacterium AC-708-I09]MCP2618542.1 Holliday ju